MAKKRRFSGWSDAGKYGKSYETGAENAASDGRAAKKSLRQRNLRRRQAAELWRLLFPVNVK